MNFTKSATERSWTTEMKTLFDIRQAVASDASALLSLRTILFAETDYLLWSPSEFNDTVDDEAQRIHRLNKLPNSRCLVAASGQALIGFINASGGQAQRQQHATTLALGVIRSHWGCGVGSQLLETVLTWSRQAGLRRVELTVHTQNERAIRLYKHLGFEIEGLRRSSLLVNGSYRDEFLMSVIHSI